MEIEVVKQSIKLLSEGRVKFDDPRDFLEKLGKAMNGSLDEQGQIDVEQNQVELELPGGSGEARTRAGESEADFGFSYEHSETVRDREQLTFGAEGKIETEDGQSIEFDLKMDISRQFFQKSSVQIQGGNAELIDPLVVNVDGEAAELSEDTFEFDVNIDGEEEEISTLESGSGFLALDRNGNGDIDDGSELFGAEIGNRFEELARYDEDKNRFIDEGDEVFDQLSIMTTNSEGKQQRMFLEQAGVEAIFLGSADTSFSYKTKDDNQLQGQLDRTGIFVSDQGDVGPVQKINFATDEAPDETGSRSPGSGDTRSTGTADRSPDDRSFQPSQGRRLDLTEDGRQSMPEGITQMPKRPALLGLGGVQNVSGLNLVA